MKFNHLLMLFNEYKNSNILNVNNKNHSLERICKWTKEFNIAILILGSSKKKKKI